MQSFSPINHHYAHIISYNIITEKIKIPRRKNKKNNFNPSTHTSKVTNFGIKNIKISSSPPIITQIYTI
uniref:Putative ovule protein n=1 Tax=Solanum chacoense TaxID=4108 RepID=A0A0V0GMA5_SOLCH